MVRIRCGTISLVSSISMVPGCYVTAAIAPPCGIFRLYFTYCIHPNMLMWYEAVYIPHSGYFSIDLIWTTLFYISVTCKSYIHEAEMLHTLIWTNHNYAMHVFLHRKIRISNFDLSFESLTVRSSHVIFSTLLSFSRWWWVCSGHLSYHFCLLQHPWLFRVPM